MTDVETEPLGKAKGMCGKYLNKLKLSELVKRTKRHPAEDRKSKHHACPSEDNRPPAGEEVLSFEEKLKQGLLEEACRELLCREEQLFGAPPPGSCQQDEEQVDRLHRDNEEQVDRLHRDNELLLLRLWTAVHDSFSPPTAGGGGGGGDRLEALRRAVRVVQRQEEHDTLWGERRGAKEEEEAPAWRPHRCLNTHDTLLRSTVESRLKTAAEEDVSLMASDARLSSPLKRELCQVGRRLKEDLLTVVRDIRPCYPEDMDVVNLYAGLYHQVFSSRLTRRVHSAAAPPLEPDDCGYLLVWVNHIYPEDILGHAELCAHIDTHALGTLLPADDHSRLEEQYLAHKQDQVNSWVSTALKQEVEHWQSGRSPEMIDGYCFSPLAVLVLEAVNSSVTEARCVLREQSHTHRITAQLHCFLMSYESRLEEFVKEKHPNCPNVMKANLVCVKQFRDYVEQTAVCLPEEVKTSCLAALSVLEDCCYGYFTGPVHLELKVWYRQLWTPGWMQDGEKVVDGLLSLLHEHLSHLSEIKPTCMEVLVSRLHSAVSVEYVRRMMKRKLRMKSRQEQETAARLMLDDAHNLDLYFTDQSSRETGMSAVLSRLAEVIRLQDPGSIQLEVATLARDYPDLSARHVSALLSVKSTLSSADLRSIKLSVEEVRPSLSSTNHGLPFFSKVTVKGTGKLGIKT